MMCRTLKQLNFAYYLPKNRVSLVWQPANPASSRFSDNPDDLIKDALWKAFLRTETEFLTLSRGQNEFSGSCCNCVLAFRDKLYCANLGDSRALLIRVDEWKPSRVKAIAISRDHKAALEKARIEKAGGYVDGNRVNGVLAICRSVGDRELKDEQFLKDPSAFRRILQNNRDEAAAAARGPTPPATAPAAAGPETVGKEQKVKDAEPKEEPPAAKPEGKSSPKDRKRKDSAAASPKPEPRDKSSKDIRDDSSETSNSKDTSTSSAKDSPKESSSSSKRRGDRSLTASGESEDRDGTPPRSKKSGNKDTLPPAPAEENSNAADVDAARRALATSSPAPRRKKEKVHGERKSRVKVLTGDEASESKKDRDASPSSNRREKEKRKEKDDDDEIEVEVEDDFNSEEEESPEPAGTGADASPPPADKPKVDPATADTATPSPAVSPSVKRSFSDRLSMKVKKLGSKLWNKPAKIPAESDPSLILRNPMVVVAAEPETKVFTRTHEDNVVIIGSDGVYDVLSNKLVARTAGKMLRRYGVDSLDMVAQELVDEAHFQGSSDDITVVVLVLNPPNAPETTNGSPAT